MSSEAQFADRFVFRAISARNNEVAPDAQELPTLDLVGAAIARASQLAAARARTELGRSLFARELSRSQAAGLLKSSADGYDACITNLNEDEGRVIAISGQGHGAAGSAGTGFVWRFHAAPDEAGARLATGATA